jgi:hypothetical protein
MSMIVHTSSYEHVLKHTLMHDEVMIGCSEGVSLGVPWDFSQGSFGHSSIFCSKISTISQSRYPICLAFELFVMKTLAVNILFIVNALKHGQHYPLTR